MAITTLAGVTSAARQRMVYTKLNAITASSFGWFSGYDQPGNPPAGTLAIGNTANGLVPTDATTGFPQVFDFGAGNTGYVAIITTSNGLQAGRFMLVDRLFHAGAYAFNAATTLASQPSYSSRVPGGTDYTGLQIWIETVTAFTGNMSVAVTYTNENGTAAHTTGTVATGIAPTIRRMIQLPLQAGDNGVQKIESVTATVATAGTFNVLVLRPLWMGRCGKIGDLVVHGIERTGLPKIFQDSALMIFMDTDTTTINAFDVLLEIING